MGASASRSIRETASAASRRRYPTSPSASIQKKGPLPTAAWQLPEDNQKNSAGGPWTTKSEEIEQDGQDPHFAASLRTIGPVVPTPTFSNSSTAGRPLDESKDACQSVSGNPTLLALQSRARLADAANEQESNVGLRGHLREFLDVQTIKKALAMRDSQAMSAEGIENHLRLKAGIVGRLGRQGLVRNVEVRASKSIPPSA
ncbi:hypothetical protein KEM54_005014 [Ascosphaera aggregata]|nr:hypothetical protein KEM54_005014 [Ascosphaera aggregata]